MCKHPEGDFIKERVDAIKEAIHFFSNDCQSDTEVWVVSHFLSQLCIDFSNEEIHASSDEPVDVVYCDAKFQVKEIYDKGRSISVFDITNLIDSRFLRFYELFGLWVVLRLYGLFALFTVAKSKGKSRYENLLQINKKVIILDLLHNSKSSAGVWVKSISEIFG